LAQWAGTNYSIKKSFGEFDLQKQIVQFDPMEKRICLICSTDVSQIQVVCSVAHVLLFSY
jgi:hypothetical protein